MILLRVLPRAEQDIEEIALWYASEGGAEIGLDFYAALERTWEQLREFPDTGKRCSWLDTRLSEVLRYRVISPFGNSLVFYRSNALGEVEVIRVLHSSRNAVKALLGEAA